MQCTLTLQCFMLVFACCLSGALVIFVSAFNESGEYISLHARLRSLQRDNEKACSFRLASKSRQICAGVIAAQVSYHDNIMADDHITFSYNF